MVAEQARSQRGELALRPRQRVALPGREGRGDLARDLRQCCLHPTIRLFAANTGGEDAELEVEILYEGLDGKLQKLKVAKLRGGASWAPTSVVPLYVNMLAAASEDGLTAIALKFKTHGVKEKDGGWKIDDLLVDPLKTW